MFKKAKENKKGFTLAELLIVVAIIAVLVAISIPIFTAQLEKDDSFKGSIGNIYQSFAGQDIYPTLEEKAANLLYFITKNHSFSDGNKRIAATMFLYFLDKNGILFADGNKLIDDHTLVALTIMIAESKPDEKEMMISLIMNCICG